MSWRWPWVSRHAYDSLLALHERALANHQQFVDAMRLSNENLQAALLTLKREGFGPAPQTAEYEPETLPSVVVSAIEERAERGSELARQLARWAERQLKTPLRTEEDDDTPEGPAEPVYPDPIEVAQRILSGATMDDLPV